MAAYGYLNHTSIDERDNQAIDAVFSAVPGDRVVIEQAWTQGEAIRPAFEKMLCSIQSGDTLYISSIDRLGLDAEDTVRLWYVITKEKGADIVVLDDPALDSRENRKLTAKQLNASAQAAFAGLAKRLLNAKRH